MIQKKENGHALVSLLVIAVIAFAIFVAYNFVSSRQEGATETQQDSDTDGSSNVKDANDLYRIIESKISQEIVNSAVVSTEELNTVDYLNFDTPSADRLIADSGNKYWVWESCGKDCTDEEYELFEKTKPTDLIIKEVFTSMREKLLATSGISIVENDVKPGTYIEHDYAIFDVKYQNNESSRLQASVEGGDAGYYIAVYAYNPNIQDDYVFVPDWDVSLGLGKYADKFTISAPKSTYNGARSSVIVTIKQENSEYANCPTEFMVDRLEDVSSFGTPPKIKLGNYYYYNSGVSECGGAELSANSDILTLSELKSEFDALGVR